MARLLPIALCALALAGCGFELRGSASLPAEMDRTRLQVADPDSLFARELRLLLEANGVTLVDAAEDAAVLRILRQRIDRRTLTVSGNARVREFELVFELRFALDGPGGETLVAPESLRLARDFQFDEQEILGATSEEELLREDLRRSMASALIRRLEAVRTP
ncbi:hypothetical protein HFP89_03925 [Wenzhouxiangella sp. XN79A]|uniref:LPS-assembly lipoprotein LptE n=1 Tax=Wenzhouxiangella sp. XN79A TaxID=2724193 RepID=UPI00144AAFB7|nr:LPS assembly lipoprotein LptE [Wenzhouxiangella sp. XN79A]NKI34307.1 hypothetical protein [Wenzhouxiangella sp. XN79A]